MLQVNLRLGYEREILNVDIHRLACTLTVFSLHICKLCFSRICIFCAENTVDKLDLVEVCRDVWSDQLNLEVWKKFATSLYYKSTFWLSLLLQWLTVPSLQRSHAPSRAR